MEAPSLLDDVVRQHATMRRPESVLEQIQGDWYIAMPVNYSPRYWCLRDHLTAIWHGWLVMTGKAQAVQFARQRRRLCGRVREA